MHRKKSTWIPLVALLLWIPTAQAEPIPHSKARVRAELAIKALAQGRQLTVRWRPDGVRPALLRGLSVATRGKTIQARALGFLAAHPRLFVPADQLRAVATRSAVGLTVVRFKQVAGPAKIEVDGGEVTVALDARGKVQSVNSQLIPMDQPIPRAKLDTRAAVGAVLGRLVGKKGPVAVPVELAGLRPTLMVMPGGGEAPTLVYRVMLPLWLDPMGRIHLVNAVSGEVIGWRPGMKVDGHMHGKEVGQ